ncbi:MAG: hypothetical protein ACFFDI_11315 [Promethearchaeota archaeon]
MKQESSSKWGYGHTCPYMRHLGKSARTVQSLLPNQKYCFLHIEVIEGAHGSFTKEELVRWIKEAGGTNIKIKFSTPVIVFKFDKKAM